MSRLNVNQIYTRTGTGSPAIREMPAFRAYNSSTGAIGSTQQTVVPIDTVTFDTNNWFNISNYRYTPQIAGYYQFNGTVDTTATNSTFIFYSIYFNGSSNIPFHKGRVATSDSQTGSGSTIIYMNGTTDYVELYARNSGTSGTWGSCSFSGFLVRPD